MDNPAALGSMSIVYVLCGTVVPPARYLGVWKQHQAIAHAAV